MPTRRDADPRPNVLLVGAGSLGESIGLTLAERGHQVVALRRRGDQVPRPMLGVSVDLTEAAPELPEMNLQYLVVALTARPRTEDAYRATYVTGMLRALDAVLAQGTMPERAVLVSSTGVYGDLPAEPFTDETTTPQPSDGPQRVLLEAERAFGERIPHGTVLRLSGLYGGSRRLIDRVADGEIGDPARWTNRIHREDAAAAVVHLLQRRERPERLYVGTDDEPALMGDVAVYLAGLLGRPAEPPSSWRVDPHQGTGKRLSNARLRATGLRLQYPSYREGYRASLTD